MRVAGVKTVLAKAMEKIEAHPLEVYDHALIEYQFAVKYAAGGGHRGQQLVEYEYEQLSAAYANLSAEDKPKVIYPPDPRDAKPAEGK